MSLKEGGRTGSLVEKGQETEAVAGIFSESVTCVEIAITQNECWKE